MEGSLGNTAPLGLYDIGADGQGTHHLEKVVNPAAPLGDLGKQTLKGLAIVANRVGGILAFRLDEPEEALNQLKKLIES